MTAIDVRPNESWAFCGMSGTGKTTLQRRIAMTLRDSGMPVTVWDPLGQYPDEISYQVRDMYDTDELDQVARYVLQARGRLEIEESEQVLPNRGELRKIAPGVNSMACLARNLNASIGANTRRPQQLNEGILRNVHNIAIFKLRPKDIGYMEDFVGRHQAHKLDELNDWTRDAREPDGGRFLWLDDDGQLHECEPLSV